VGKKFGKGENGGGDVGWGFLEGGVWGGVWGGGLELRSF